MHVTSAAYGTAARLRRGWYARHPAARRRLPCRVISTGNLVMGGSGKTPVVAAVAAMLRDAGERPAIVSRGYGRPEKTAGVLLVSDGVQVLESVERAGDEPLMLARQVAGVPVLVSADRYAAGQAAVALGCTVIVLDDGFQHVQLARNVDLLMVDAADLGERVLPFGRLREPLEAAGAADAALVHGTEAEAARIAALLRIRSAFTVTRHYDTLRALVPWGEPVEPPSGPVIAVAGIARPQRFFAALTALGFDVAQELAFRDHRWFSAADLDRIEAAARAAGAGMVVTTEKDAVRLERWRPALRVAYLPMRVSIEPAGQFARLVAGSPVGAESP